MTDNKLRLLIWFVLIHIFILMSHCQNTSTPSDENYVRKRNAMVEDQIIARGVKDTRVISAMLKVPRHLFVNQEDLSLAYTDQPLAVGYGQTISQPYIVAYMTEILALDRSSKVLEIGTGSGYQAAVLAELCDSVFSIEIIEPLGRQAETLLCELGYTNVFIKIGDGYLGWPEHAPFDAIIVTCAPDKVPLTLKKQLAEGGRLIIPVGDSFSQELVLIVKKGDEFITKNVLPVRFVPMMKQDGTRY
jgi:protein-L-isoaspartate(D-aspartate) O-methyltransferase